MADLGPGEKLGRFLIDKKLGKGASGVVYLAQDTVLAQHVALKVLHPWLIDVVEVRERFKREIVLTRRITAAGVCRIHDLHEDSDITFVTMEYIEGKTLSEIIQTDGRQTPTRVLEMLVGLAPALDAAHAAGIVHRDLKPGNIMVRHDGSLCVLDFGMATAADVTRITQAGRTVGSLRFIAPEVWQGEPATAKSDIYAVGVVLFACMAGRLPYEARTPAEAFAAQKQGPPSLMEHNAAVTPGIDAVVRQAMARRPQDRFDNVEQVRAAFATALNFEEATSSTGTVIVRPRDPQDPDNVRLTPMKEAEGDVFSSTPVRVPKPVMIGVAIVIAVIAVAITAALVAAPTRAVDAGSDGAVDAGTPHHLVVRAASPPPIGDTVDDIGDDTGSDDSAPDRVVPRASS
ncbi:MAG TPA: serine/threonine-protein kinase, partial [Myxococcota bacterium]